MKTYQKIASLLAAIENCKRANNLDWLERHQDTLDELIKARMPSGSGFDVGTSLDDTSTPEKLVFTTSFRHLNDAGYYDGWTEHTVIITPSLQFGFNIRITGRDRNQIKDYIAETFHQALCEE